MMATKRPQRDPRDALRPPLREEPGLFDSLVLMGVILLGVLYLFGPPILWLLELVGIRPLR